MSDELIYLNKVKRDKLWKLEIKHRIEELRNDLPKYTIEEIREHTLPYFDALVKNLDEKGFHSSSFFLTQLVDFQTKAREETGPGSNIWMRPQLRFSNRELQHLTEELRKAEEFNFVGEHKKECETFLKLAIHFAFSHQDWWWLGEQLLVQLINMSRSYPSLTGQFEAVSRFTYGKFLIDNLKEHENAKDQLLIARELCFNKGQNIAQYFPEEKGTLFMRINYYLHRCLIKEANILTVIDFRKAIEVAIQAKKRAAESCYREGETQALLLKGMCHLNLGESKDAIISFTKALKIEEASNNKQVLCKLMIQLSKAYLQNGDTNLSLNILKELKDTASEFQLHFYLAQAYKNMGEHYLNNGEFCKARQLLNKSLYLFEQDNNTSTDIALVQILEAIAGGLELFSTYVDLVFKADTTADPSGMEYINKLINWKDSREPFWDLSVESDRSFIDPTPSDFKMNTKIEPHIETDLKKENTVEVIKSQDFIEIHDNKQNFYKGTESVKFLDGNIE